MARIQQLQVAGAVGVPMGVAGTGEAVILDNDIQFDPVKFAEDRRREASQQKEAHRKERLLANEKIMTDLTAKPEGLYYAQPLQQHFQNLRTEWGTPDKIDLILQGNNPMANEYYVKRAEAISMNQTQKALSAAIANDVEMVKKNPEKFDPESVAMLREITQEKIPIGEAAELYKRRGGTVLEPAYDIEDIVESIRLEPTVVNRKANGATYIDYDPQQVDAAVETTLEDPKFKPYYDYLSKKLGSVDAAKQLVKDKLMEKREVKTYAQRSVGGRGVGQKSNKASATIYDNGPDLDVAYNVGVQITSNGKITPMHNFSTGSTNANDSSVFGSVNRLYKNKDGELVYEILVPKQSAYSSSVKENELKPGVNYIIQQGEGGEKNFIEVRNTETRTVPASDVNNTIVMDITGTNPVQIYTDYLNSRGKAAAPKKGGAKPSNSGKTIPLSEWRKLSLAERQRKIKEGYTQGK